LTAAVVNSVVAVAEGLRQIYNLEPPILAADVARQLGIEVYYKPFTGPAAIWVPDQAMIIVNSRARNGRRNFSCAHELAHVFLHTGSPIYADSHTGQIEQEANVFAAALLMPADDVRYRCLTMSMDTKQLAYYYRVSIQAMGIRLSELGISANHRLN
jgi:Zn-dependent peptidase ImmA (M78 family)